MYRCGANMAHYGTEFSVRRLWTIFVVSMLVMFGMLLYIGSRIYQAAPPIPTSVQATSGATIYTRADIERGLAVWQSMGGMQQGSIWGHGSYSAPDWSADWLHREAESLLDILSRAQTGGDYRALSAPDQARMRFVLTREMRANTYDQQSGIVSVSPERAQAIAAVGAHFRTLFEANSPEALALRERYAFPAYAKLQADEAAAVEAFFFWTAWAATTERPGESVTYTSNWPHEPWVGNTPTADVFLWTIISIFVLLGGIGALVWYYAREFDIWRRDIEPQAGFARLDFMTSAMITPSMLDTWQYFLIVAALFAAQ